MELVLSGAWLCIREAPPLPPGLPHNTTGPPKQNLLQLRILAATPTVEVAPDERSVKLSWAGSESAKPSIARLHTDGNALEIAEAMIQMGRERKKALVHLAVEMQLRRKVEAVRAQQEERRQGSALRILDESAEPPRDLSEQFRGLVR